MIFTMFIISQIHLKQKHSLHSCILNSFEIDIYIDIYSLNGEIIKNIESNNLINDGTYFYKFPSNGWDGSDNSGNDIANGTYIYNLKVLSNNYIVHNGTYKLTKLE